MPLVTGFPFDFFPADAAASLRGGVIGAFSVVLEDDAWVGRIIRARKLSSTSFSFFVGGYSFAACFGGGPKLGRGRLMVELCLLRLLFAPGFVAEVVAVEALALLGERPTGSIVWMVPLARECDCRAALTLEPEAAVWVISPAGSRTGRVGDLGLGLTNPMPDEGDGWSGGGRLMDEDLAVLEDSVLALGVSVFSGCRELRSGVFVGILGVDVVAGLFGALLAVGDLDLVVDLLAAGTVRGLGTGRDVALVFDFAAGSPLAFPLSLPLLVPFTGSASVLTISVELLPEAVAFSAASSVPNFLGRR